MINTTSRNAVVSVTIFAVAVVAGIVSFHRSSQDDRLLRDEAEALPLPPPENVARPDDLVIDGSGVVSNEEVRDHPDSAVAIVANRTGPTDLLSRPTNVFGPEYLAASDEATKRLSKLGEYVLGHRELAQLDADFEFGFTSALSPCRVSSVESILTTESPRTYHVRSSCDDGNGPVRVVATFNSDSSLRGIAIGNPRVDVRVASLAIANYVMVYEILAESRSDRRLPAEF